MLRILMFAGMLLGAGVLAADYADQVARAPANAASVQAANMAPANSRTMVLKANDGGHFEVDAKNIVYASLHALAEEGALDKGTLRAALNKLGLDPNKLDPQKA